MFAENTFKLSLVVTIKTVNLNKKYMEKANETYKRKKNKEKKIL